MQMHHGSQPLTCAPPSAELERPLPPRATHRPTRSREPLDTHVIRRLWIGVVLAIGVACGRTTGMERADVMSYLERTHAWAPVEAETAQVLDRILATQFVDEAEVNREIAASRPRLTTHLVHVRDYRPRTSDVARIHARYVRAWERLLSGFDAIDQGFSSGDYSKLAQGRQAIDSWRQQIVEVADELGELVRHLGIETTGAVASARRRSST